MPRRKEGDEILKGVLRGEPDGRLKEVGKVRDVCQDGGVNSKKYEEGKKCGVRENKK